MSKSIENTRQHNYSGDPVWVDIRTLAKPKFFKQNKNSQIEQAQLFAEEPVKPVQPIITENTVFLVNRDK